MTEVKLKKQLLLAVKAECLIHQGTPTQASLAKQCQTPILSSCHKFFDDLCNEFVWEERPRIENALDLHASHVEQKVGEVESDPINTQVISRTIEIPTSDSATAHLNRTLVAQATEVQLLVLSSDIYLCNLIERLPRPSSLSSQYW